MEDEIKSPVIKVEQTMPPDHIVSVIAGFNDVIPKGYGIASVSHIDELSFQLTFRKLWQKPSQ